MYSGLQIVSVDDNTLYTVVSSHLRNEYITSFHRSHHFSVNDSKCSPLTMRKAKDELQMKRPSSKAVPGIEQGCRG